jgi:primosomal protein N' (replication factor Y)
VSAVRRERQEWLLPREGELRRGLLAEVALELPTWKTYAFGVPAELAESVRPGARVTAPHGRSGREVEGYCLAVSEGEWDQTLTLIQSATPPAVELSAPLVELARWVGQYYQCTPGAVMSMLLPRTLGEVRPKRERIVRRTEAPIPEKASDRLRRLLEAVPREGVTLASLRESGAATDTLIRGAVRKGLLAVVQREVALTTDDSGRAEAPMSEEDGYALTEAQAVALQALSDAVAGEAFRAFLLFGVPGSGKTEVYVRAIRAAIARGRQAILLVPEIALATQVVERLARRFARVAVLHGQMSPRSRVEALARIARGEVDVVIGTRTAVYAPCCRLGLIVVDEEQEGSFKSLSSPYYHARDVALKRAQIERIPVVLGSATPALETWYNATLAGRYQLLELGTRVPGAELPRAELVVSDPDEGLSEDAYGASADSDANRGILSTRLRTALLATLKRRDQAILLHNRRGYAVALRCDTCGLPLRCPKCMSLLVLHHSDETVRCHRCSHRDRAPQRCPVEGCGGALQRGGLAIQRLEEELRRVAPDARVLRLDSDTMRTREDYQTSLRAFAEGAADVLIGTQMIAKGLDFPVVRLVGVIDADAPLYLRDFRATEFAFQLIMQVVGRAGRKAGESLAIVQMRREPPPALKAALAMDYRQFADAELAVRQRYAYPPFVRLARLVFADARPDRAADAARRAAETLRELAAAINPAVRVDPPEACAAPRLREMNRHQVLLRGPRETGVQKVLAAALTERKLPAVQRLTVDVDPMDFS